MYVLTIVLEQLIANSTAISTGIRRFGAERKQSPISSPKRTELHSNATNDKVY